MGSFAGATGPIVAAGRDARSGRTVAAGGPREDGPSRSGGPVAGGPPPTGGAIDPAACGPPVGPAGGRIVGLGALAAERRDQSAGGAASSAATHPSVSSRIQRSSPAIGNPGIARSTDARPCRAAQSTVARSNAACSSRPPTRAT